MKIREQQVIHISPDGKSRKVAEKEPKKKKEKEKKKPEGDPAVHRLTYPEVDRMAHHMAIEISALNLSFREIVLVAISRGGLIPATMISHKLLSHSLGKVRLNMHNGRVISIEPTINELNAAALKYVAQLAVGGAHIVFVDDINDSGHTMSLVCRSMKDCMQIVDRPLPSITDTPGSVLTAALVTSPKSCMTVDVAGMVLPTAAPWIQFPWETSQSTGRIRPATKSPNYRIDMQIDSL